MYSCFGISTPGSIPLAMIKRGSRDLTRCRAFDRGSNAFPRIFRDISETWRVLEIPNSSGDSFLRVRRAVRFRALRRRALISPAFRPFGDRRYRIFETAKLVGREREMRNEGFFAEVFARSGRRERDERESF